MFRRSRLALHVNGNEDAIVTFHQSLYAWREIGRHKQVSARERKKGKYEGEREGKVRGREGRESARERG
jgi:hypothetical protein